MSLLEEILSGIKRESPSGDVPPNLKRIVSSSMTKQRTRRRAILLSVFAVIMVGIGYGAILFFEAVPSHVADQNDSKKVLQALQGLRSESMQTQSSPPAATDSPPQSPPFPHSAAAQQEKPHEGQLVIGSQTRDNEGRRMGSSGVGGNTAINFSDAPSGSHGETGGTKVPEPRELRTSIREPGTADKEERQINRSEPIPAGKTEKDLHLYTAKTYEEAGDFGKALAEYKKALQWDGNNHIVLNNIAGLLIRLGLYREAMTYAERSLAVKKDYVPSLVNLAVAHLKSGESEEGTKSLVRALKLAPTDRATLSNLAFLHEKAGEYAKSYDLYRRLAATDDIDGHLGMARACEKENRAREAETIYRNILKGEPNQRAKKIASDRLAALGSVSDRAR